MTRTPNVISAPLAPLAQADDFNRYWHEVGLPHDAAAEPPTLSKAELVELMFEHGGLNKREAKTWSMPSLTKSTTRANAMSQENCWFRQFPSARQGGTA
jgi:hypothetical protein